MKTALTILAIAVAVFSTAALIAFAALDRELPPGVAGAEADALAHEIMEQVNIEAWRQTGAVSWTFKGNRRHLWDRRRHLAQVKWGETEVIVDLGGHEARAWVAGAEALGPALQRLAQRARSFWTNDAFWLNPIAKFYDEGASRRRVMTEEGPALLITYSNVGQTPGDSYLWHHSGRGLPTSWQMWVSNIPVGGLSATWEGWRRLDTGALVATAHRFGPVTLRLTEVEGAADLEDLVEFDPFCRLDSVPCKESTLRRGSPSE